MPLRFAIIKEYRTNVGGHHEDIVYELGEEDILSGLVDHLGTRLEDIRKKKYLEPKYTKEEAKAALVVAFNDVIKDFKKITIKIM